MGGSFQAGKALPKKNENATFTGQDDVVHLSSSYLLCALSFFDIHSCSVSLSHDVARPHFNLQASRRQVISNMFTSICPPSSEHASSRSQAKSSSVFVTTECWRCRCDFQKLNMT